MEKFQKFVSAIAGLVLKASGAKVNQVQRNALKNDALEALLADFAALDGVAITRTNDGIVLEVPNDELGSLYFEFDLKIKDLDFDVVAAVNDRDLTLQARNERAAKAAERKAKVAAERKAKE